MDINSLSKAQRDWLVRMPETNSADYEPFMRWIGKQSSIDPNMRMSDVFYHFKQNPDLVTKNSSSPFSDTPNFGNGLVQTPAVSRDAGNWSAFTNSQRHIYGI